MIRRYGWRTAIAAVLTGALVLTVSQVIAGGNTTATGGRSEAIKVRRGPDATTTTSTTFVDVPSSAVTLSVPSGRRALFVARFFAESQCSQAGTDGDWCGIRIRTGATPLQPDSDFAFDSTNNGAESDASWESHATERSIVLGPGNYTFTVQYRTTEADTTFRVDDWSFSVERFFKS